MKEIEALGWDSDFFKMKIGKIVLRNSSEFNPILFRQQAERNFDLVYVFSYQKMLPQNMVNLANLDLVDILITMSKAFDKKLYANNEYDFRNFLSKKELNECYQIAEETSIVSRFFAEDLIGPQKTKSLYRKWIDNSLKRIFSDGLFVIKEGDYVAGVHIIKVDSEKAEGSFTLTGINPKFKRLGLGRKLWNQSFGFFANETNINIIKSSFSLQNIDSFNYHLKMGFCKIEEIKYIYHFRNKK